MKKKYFLILITLAARSGLKDLKRPDLGARISYKILLFTLLSMPLFVFAARPTNFKELINLILADIITPLIALIFGLAFIGFLWGAFQYIWKADDINARKEGAQKMLYGIIALFIMFSVWGLVNILVSTFGINFAFPQLGTGGG